MVYTACTHLFATSLMLTSTATITTTGRRIKPFQWMSTSTDMVNDSVMLDSKKIQISFLIMQTCAHICMMAQDT